MASHHVDDRWLWLGFAVFSLLAARSTRHAITDIVRLTRIDPAQYEHGDGGSSNNNNEPSNSPEDAINIPVLATLATSPNANISHAAISLVIARFWRDRRAVANLDKDLTSRDPKLEARGHTALAFLRAWSTAPIAHDPDPYGGFPSELNVDDLPLDTDGEGPVSSSAAMPFDDDSLWRTGENLGLTFAPTSEGFWTGGVEPEPSTGSPGRGVRGASPLMDWVEVPTRPGTVDGEGRERQARRHVVVGLGERHRDAVIVERAEEGEMR